MSKEKSFEHFKGDKADRDCVQWASGDGHLKVVKHLVS